jgi:uncharacterized membrane protein
MSMLNFATLLGPSALVTKEFKTETNPTDGLYVRIVGRKAGLIAWLLTLIGIDTTTVFEVYGDKLVYRNSSLSGQMITIFPINSICTTSSGFFKPILFIILGGLFAFMGLMSLIGAIANTDMLVSAFILLILAAIFIALYYFRKVLLISVGNTGAAVAAIAFKRSVIEGIEIKEENAIHVVELINFLVLAQARRS